jgi:hypothetical protein
LLLGAVCSAAIASDLARHKQHMWIMNLVWPITALFGTVWVAWQYFTYGRVAAHEKKEGPMRRREAPSTRSEMPLPIMVANGALHCGSGCTLGDIVAEWLVFAVPQVAVAFGYGSLFSDKIFAVWIADYIFAYALGIVFQYFTIAPMRGLSLGRGLVAAIKADTWSLSAWQLGMYGFMALAHFYVFGRLFHAALKTDTVEFWFIMQVAMMCGFLTAYPVNWWLIQASIKEKM